MHRYFEFYGYTYIGLDGLLDLYNLYIVLYLLSPLQITRIRHAKDERLEQRILAEVESIADARLTMMLQGKQRE